MAYILDVAVILIVLLAVFIGYRRGFVKSVIKLVGCVLAVIIAGLLSPMVAGGIYDTFASDKLQETIAAEMTAADAQSALAGIRGVLDDLPKPVVNALESCGLGTPEEMLDNIKGSLDGGVDAVAEAVAVKVIRPVAVALLSALCFFILFILLIILVAVLANLINKVFKLPLLKQMNGALGAVMGALEGVVIVLVAVTVVQLMAASSRQDSWISPQDIQDSFIVSRVAKVNPLTDTLQSIIDTLPAESSGS